MKDKLEEIIKDLDEVSDRIYLLKDKPGEFVEHRYHEKVYLPIVEILAKVKNLEAEISRRAA